MSLWSCIWDYLQFPVYGNVISIPQVCFNIPDRDNTPEGQHVYHMPHAYMMGILSTKLKNMKNNVLHINIEYVIIALYAYYVIDIRLLNY